MSIPSEIIQVLEKGSLKDKKALFQFSNESIEEVVEKFRFWAIFHCPEYFTSSDADFHEEIDINNLKTYLGYADSFVDIVFRGGGKTARTKLLIAFCIANDLNHRRKYIKVLSHDGINSRQIVTDVYNILVKPSMVKMYAEIWEQKGDQKREETMSSFTTSTGVKLSASTVGKSQRGQLQENARPDLIWYEDFETRDTLRSAVKTQAIWDNMEEARTGLSNDGACIYTCNYVSERGNVHKLVTRPSHDRHIVMIVPIISGDVIAWSRYSMADIEQMRLDDSDFPGERLCQPSAGADILFNRHVIDTMPALSPIEAIAGLKKFRKYDASHRYAGASDIGGGVGLDSSTTCIIDFDTYPAQVAATFRTNTIKPDQYAYEIKRHGDEYGTCLMAPEINNHGHGTMAIFKMIYDLRKIFVRRKKDTAIVITKEEEKTKEYGWHTNILTKPKMMNDLIRAVDSGLLLLNDPELIREARSYSRDDLMDKEEDPRLTTRHFDLLTACAIAWQMKDYVGFSEKHNKKVDELQEFMNNSGFDPFAVL